MKSASKVRVKTAEQSSTIVSKGRVRNKHKSVAQRVNFDLPEDPHKDSSIQRKRSPGTKGDLMNRKRDYGPLGGSPAKSNVDSDDKP